MTSARLIVSPRAPIAARDDSAPDLERTAADGFSVLAFYADLSDAGSRDACAVVEIRHYGRTIDTLDVTAADALSVWRHASLHSAAYADALNNRADDSEPVDVAERIAAYGRAESGA